MRRTVRAILCFMLGAITFSALALGVRSRTSGDDVICRRLKGDGQSLLKQTFSARSELGGLRLAIRWGDHMDFGILNDAEYGPPGLFYAVQRATAYPTWQDPSAKIAYAGFGAEWGQYPWGWSGPLSERWLSITLPYWFIALISAIAPLRWINRSYRRARRSRRGFCINCGYDLRATTGNCPECGGSFQPMTPLQRGGAKVMVGGLATVMIIATPLLRRASFFNQIADPIALTSQVQITASPTVWASRKIPVPVDFAPYTQVLAGMTINFPMVPIPGGTFRMGSPQTEKDRNPDEGPPFELTIEPFYMGQFEVTQAEYDAFLITYSKLISARITPIPKDKLADAVTYPTPIYEVEVGPMLAQMGRGAGYPAVIMSQFSARQFTKWLSGKTGRFYRLATEAEWEYACRAGSTTAYSFGDDPKGLKDYGWYIDNSETDKMPDGGYHHVGMKKPNAWGLYDMHGNVAEWVIDGYAADAYERAGTGTLTGEDVIEWPKKRYPRIIRGGGWSSEATDCRSAARGHATPKLNAMDPDIPKSPYWETCGFWVGFRVVCPVREPSEEIKRRFWGEEDPKILKDTDRDRDVREMAPLYP